MVFSYKGADIAKPTPIHGAWYAPDGTKLDGVLLEYRNARLFVRTRFANGVIHCVDGPAVKVFFQNGLLAQRIYREDGELHREDGPALEAFVYVRDERVTLSEEYWIRGRRHRQDGPAVIHWYHHNMQVMRRSYYVNGMQHRTDGPARESYFEDGQIESEEYYENGKYLEPTNGAMVKSANKVYL